MFFLDFSLFRTCQALKTMKISVGTIAARHRRSRCVNLGGAQEWLALAVGERTPKPFQGSIMKLLQPDR